MNLPDVPIPAKNQKKTPNGIYKTDKLIWELTVVTKCWSCGSNNWNPGGASWLKKSVAVVPYSGGVPDSESLTSLYPLFPYLHVLCFFCFSAL